MGDINEAAERVTDIEPLTALAVVLLIVVLFIADIWFVRSKPERCGKYCRILKVCITVTVGISVWNFLKDPDEWIMLVLYAPYILIDYIFNGPRVFARIVEDMVSLYFTEIIAMLGILVIPWLGFLYCKLTAKYRRRSRRR